MPLGVWYQGICEGVTLWFMSEDCIIDFLGYHSRYVWTSEVDKFDGTRIGIPVKVKYPALGE